MPNSNHSASSPSASHLTPNRDAALFLQHTNSRGGKPIQFQTLNMPYMVSCGTCRAVLHFFRVGANFETACAKWHAESRAVIPRLAQEETSLLTSIFCAFTLQSSDVRAIIRDWNIQHFKVYHNSRATCQEKHYLIFFPKWTLFTSARPWEERLSHDGSLCLVLKTSEDDNDPW